MANLGTDIKQQFSVGYSLNDQRPSFLSDFSPDPALRAAFARDIFPHSEVTSTPFLSYTLYTPTFRNDRKPDPKFRNTRRLPSQSTLSIVGDKFARIWGQNVTFFLDARNVLDSTPIQNLTPNNTAGENPYIDIVGSDYLIYYTETGRAGGAYLRDNNGDHVEDWNPVNDPRVFAEGRNIRVGVGVTF